MARIEAICAECGAHLSLDSERAVCPYCGASVETGHSTGYELTVRENLSRDGDEFLEMGETLAAEKCFRKLTAIYPYDYRGWWGLLRLLSADFTREELTAEEYAKAGEYGRKACALATDASLKTRFYAYLNRVTVPGSPELPEPAAEPAEPDARSQERAELEREIARLNRRLKLQDKFSERMFWLVLGLVSAVLVTVFLVKVLRGGLPFREALLFFLVLEFAAYVLASLASLVSRLFRNRRVKEFRRERRELIGRLDALREK